MPQIQLLDGKKINFEKSITGFDLTKCREKTFEYLATLKNPSDTLSESLISTCKDGIAENVNISNISHHSSLKISHSTKYLIPQTILIEYLVRDLLAQNFCLLNLSLRLSLHKHL